MLHLSSYEKKQKTWKSLIEKKCSIILKAKINPAGLSYM
jgi:hypothetical protein